MKTWFWSFCQWKCPHICSFIQCKQIGAAAPQPHIHVITQKQFPGGDCKQQFEQFFGSVNTSIWSLLLWVDILRLNEFKNSKHWSYTQQTTKTKKLFFYKFWFFFTNLCFSTRFTFFFIFFVKWTKVDNFIVVYRTKFTFFNQAWINAATAIRTKLKLTMFTQTTVKNTGCTRP